MIKVRRHISGLNRQSEPRVIRINHEIIQVNTVFLPECFPVQISQSINNLVITYT